MKNKKSIILLSGEIASGKSTFSRGMTDGFDFRVVSSRAALEHLASDKYAGNVPRKRDFLQTFGKSLDKESGGGWLLNYFQSTINEVDNILIDCVRIEDQVTAFRRAYGQAVFHIHLVAPAEIRKQWFIERKRSDDNFKNDNEAIEKFELYSADSTEKNVSKLKQIADLVINTADSTNISDHVIRAASFMRILPPIHHKNVDVVIGGQFGSEGKGQVAAYLAPEYDCLVRVGGPNAGHKVYNEPTPDVFHIIPSGTNKARNSKLVLGPGTVIDIDTLMNEISKFALDPGRLVIDANAVIISEADKKLEEKHDKIGSTKRGVGAATSKNLLEHRLGASEKYKAKSIPQLRPFIGSAHEEYEKINTTSGKILLEGTQGTFLSLYNGFYPYVTSRDTTVAGCLSEAGIGLMRVRKIVMVVRRYPIRVQNPQDGTSGPFLSQEITLEEVSKRSGHPLESLKVTEKTSTTKRQRRIAEFNWALFRKACELNTPTDIAFTFSDYITFDNQKARRYDQLSHDTTKFIDELERCAEVPVSLISTGFSNRSIIDRRNWI
jgi:adenylosuccinate synthase